MISTITEEYTDQQVYSVLKGPVKQWFKNTFGTFTPPQRYAITEIHKGENVLISSPTGSGKTLSAFLASLNELFMLAEKNELEDKVYVLYISPLKALNNDIHRNLQVPLEGISKLSDATQEVRVGVRTGDTPTSERAKQTRKPPHILITTPESLAILLNSPKFVEHLKAVRYVIIDEIHSLAENKRGTHLSLSLERLERQIKKPPIRIGLSATISPLKDVAQFLVGTYRSCRVVDVNFLKKIEITVMSPVKDMIYTPPEMVQHKLYKLLDNLISEHKTTLIFTNTRSGTERIVHNLQNNFGNKYVGVIGAHHSSLSKEVRHNVEERLKNGELKVVVSSTSLELGVDIGSIDLVILLGSPKSVTRALQRIGRSGHKLNETSKGILLVTNRDDLVECTVLAKAAREGKLDKVYIPQNCLDVLAQHIIGLSLEQGWTVDEAYGLITRAYPYRELSYNDYLEVLDYLNGDFGELQERRVYGKIRMNDDKTMFGRRGRMIRPIYYMNVGTIPEEVAVTVKTSNGHYIGRLDEGFTQRLKKGDIFVLGGQPYLFRYVRGMKMTVEHAIGKRPTVPSWYSESLPLTFDLAMEINAFRDKMNKLLKDKSKKEVLTALEKEFKLNSTTALAIYNYFSQQKKYLRIPNDKHIIIEDYIDVDGRHNLIFHALFGRRVNDALSRYFARLVSTTKKVNVGIQISDNGFVIILPKGKKPNYSDLYHDVCNSDMEAILRESLEGSELLKRRFRHVATRSFLVLKQYLGYKRSVGRQQMSSFFLYHIIKKFNPNFPVIKETFREILEDAMSIENAKKVIKDIISKNTFLILRNDRDVPSPFAHNMATGASDTIRLEDKHKLIQYLHEHVMRSIEESA